MKEVSLLEKIIYYVSKDIFIICFCLVSILIVLYMAINIQTTVNEVNTYWLDYINNTGCLNARTDTPPPLNASIEWWGLDRNGS